MGVRGRVNLCEVIYKASAALIWEHGYVEVKYM